MVSKTYVFEDFLRFVKTKRPQKSKFWVLDLFYSVRNLYSDYKSYLISYFDSDFWVLTSRRPLNQNDISGIDKMVYKIFFLGLNFVSGLHCTLKRKTVKKS